MRITNDYLESVFYLYPDQSAAEQGKAIGGTGFFVGVKLDDNLGRQLYAVTNRHVIESGNVVIRLNTRGGEIASIDTDERDWIFHLAGDDLAILHFEADKEEHKVSFYPSEYAWTEENISQEGLGVGDETFSVGRVISQEGKQRNTPTVRFGNIAQMPAEPIESEINGKPLRQVSFLVEARSISGYSGAPVYAYIPPSSIRGISDDGHLMARSFASMAGPMLLGINWAHMNDFLTARNRDGKELDFKIQTNSGMMAVVPAWKLEEMLEMPEVKRRRDAVAKARAEARPEQAATMDTADDEEGIESRLNRAVRKMLEASPNPKKSGD